MPEKKDNFMNGDQDLAAVEFSLEAEAAENGALEIQNNFVYLFLKRAVDVFGSVIGIVLLSPFMLLTILAIKMDSEGPILANTPKRVGKDGKLFRMYKFRSMYKNAIQILQRDPKLMEEYKKNSYKLKNDPRITKVGKFIRKYSVDEMPQFFNILKGEMSFVGPRAYYPFELEEQQKKYPNSRKHVKIILRAKPGLTGVWQVSGRSEVNFDKRVEMDALYVQKKSIVYDLLIILRTVPAVLFGRGAI
ncbi:sugar transferase [Patescibacteria group bacterium]|nr:sugar transferase [Patescibacteria group bacterium]MCL5409404.1 sugar transferase [Patescibacteria group bacterium]